MIRNHCAACGRSINRTDSIFELSDGTLCQDCKARLAPGKAPVPVGIGVALTMALAALPELAARPQPKVK